MTGPTNWKKWLMSGGDPDSVSLFHFPHHCGIEHFIRFIIIPHTIFTILGDMTETDKVINPQNFGKHVTCRLLSVWTRL